MSQTSYVKFRGMGFWAHNVVYSVFLKHLIDVASERLSSDKNVWLTEAVEHWRVHAVVSDLGVYLNDDWSQSQIDVVIEMCRKAAQTIRASGDIPACEIAS